MLLLPGLTRFEIGLTLDDDSSSDEDDGRPLSTLILNGTASSSGNANGSGSPAFAAASATTTTTTTTLPASGPRPNVGEHVEVQWCSPAGNHKWYRGRVLASLGPRPVIRYTDGDEMELGEDEVWRLAPDEIWRITQSARRLPTAPVLANRRPTDPSATGSAASSAEAAAMLPTGPIPPVPKAQPPLLHVLSSQSTISSSSVSPSPRPDHVDVKDVQRSTLDVADGLVGRCAVAVVGGAAGAGTHNCPPGAAPKGANGLKMTWSMAIGKWQESPDLPVRQANSTSSSTGPDEVEFA